MKRHVLARLFLVVIATSARAADAPRPTVTEKTDYKATSRHADVVAFCEQLAKQAPVVRLGELGTSGEGRKLPLVIIADPPVATPEEAARSKKLVVFAMGNIHAGEVDGKEEAAHGKPYEFLGFVEEEKDGHRVSTGKPKSYELIYWGGTETTLAVRLPYAYLIPASQTKAVENLQRHGVILEQLRDAAELDVEAYKVEEITRTPAFQKHQPLSLRVTPRKESQRVAAGTIVVRTAQPLGTFAAFLLEPQSCDGLTTWNFFDDALKEGKDYPVLRLPATTRLTTAPVKPLPQERPEKK